MTGNYCRFFLVLSFLYFISRIDFALFPSIFFLLCILFPQLYLEWRMEKRVNVDGTVSELFLTYVEQELEV